MTCVYLATATILTTALVAVWGLGQERGSIPAHLQDCYREPPPHLLPMTVQTAVEILRKIQFNSYTPVSLAQQAADVLYWFSIDGLERDPNVFPQRLDVVPYRRTGFQALRQDLLYDKLLAIKHRTFEANMLSLSEKCTLHLMMSTTVDPWERGDELRTCSRSYTYQDFRGSRTLPDRSRLSTCPVEHGAVLTPAGTVSLGRAVTGLVTALSPQKAWLVELMSPQQLATITHSGYNGGAATDSVDSLWAATIAGDLAQVAVLQSPQYDPDLTLGLPERWNDTLIPTRLYLADVPYTTIEKRNWQLTNAQILGDIDGLLLGQMASHWRQHASDLRLSQLVELYYLDSRGGPVTVTSSAAGAIEEARACRRGSAFDTFMRDHRQTLTEQTKNFAMLLSTRTTSYFNDGSVLVQRVNRAVEQFIRHYPELVGVEKCPLQEQYSPRLSLTVILDATWPPYTSLQFIVGLMQKVDVSYYGSDIAVLNGDSSEVRVDPTSSPLTVYQQMTSGRHSREEPYGLVLRSSLQALRTVLEEANLKERDSNRPRSARQEAVLVVGFSATLATSDFRIASEILYDIKSQNPALRFVYLTSHANAGRFEQLRDVARSQHDTIVTGHSARLELVIPKVTQALHSARSLKPAYCQRQGEHQHQHWPESTYEEYVSPGQTVSYWIHPDYLCGSLTIVKTTFRNHDYGELYVCMSRHKHEQGQCLEAGAGQEVTHSVVGPCERWGSGGGGPQQWDPGCLPIYFTVMATRSRNRCREYECRFPDQVKFSIIVQDLRCVHVNGVVCADAPRVSPALVLTVIVVVLATLSYTWS